MMQQRQSDQVEEESRLPKKMRSYVSMLMLVSTTVLKHIQCKKLQNACHSGQQAVQHPYRVIPSHQDNLTVKIMQLE